MRRKIIMALYKVSGLKLMDALTRAADATTDSIPDGISVITANLRAIHNKLDSIHRELKRIRIAQKGDKR